nr:MAG: major capsid protein [Microvirus sp.]
MIQGNKLFQNVRGAPVLRSAHDLSYSKLMTADMGLIYPVLCDEAIPGDTWNIANEMVIRMQPMVAPILHQIDIKVDYFFVPYRILWDGWENFITGGEHGDDASVLPRVDPEDTDINNSGKFWDYIGLPPGVIPRGCFPLRFPFLAYKKIWNDFYRDENLQEPIDLEEVPTNGWGDILRCAWEKDYFTSALLTQQKGTAPALPISGLTSAVFNSANFPFDLPIRFNGEGADVFGVRASGIPTFLTSNGNDTEALSGTLGARMTTATGGGLDMLNDNTVDLSSATTFNVADLRLAVQTQKWLERNNRAGSRYTEFLQSHFNVSPKDERLTRPEFISGTRNSVIVSEVLQTSKTDNGTDPSPQGNMAGHGIAVSSENAGRYFVTEFGVIMGLMRIVPKTMYTQGINRQWLRRDKLDFPFPEFVNLSEQAIETAEIYATNVADENTLLFGYQGQYDELRFKPNQICSKMRDDFNFWHLGREFSSAPSLNASFITCTPRKDIFAVPTEPGFIVYFGNRLKAIRPIPGIAEPGSLDHN